MTLGGDVDIHNELSPLSAPILAKVRIASNSRLTAVTGGEINIAVQPDPSLGVKALAESNDGTVRVTIDRGLQAAISAGEHRIRQQFESPGFGEKAIRLEVRATSPSGRVNIASVPAAPLPPP